MSDPTKGRLNERGICTQFIIPVLIAAASDQKYIMKRHLMLGLLASTLFLAGCCYPPHAPAWEYQRVWDFKTVQTLSAEGWTLEGFHSFDSSDTGTYYILKRRTSSAKSCSATRGVESAPNLAGGWEMGGPYHVGQPCKILQSGNDLTFINENGDKARGVLKSPTEVIATDWEGGLIGALNNDATRINWKNGTWWLRGNR